MAAAFVVEREYALAPLPAPLSVPAGRGSGNFVDQRRREVRAVDDVDGHAPAQAREFARARIGTAQR